MDTSTKTAFHIEAKIFIRKMINQRRNMIRMNVSKKNLLAVARDVDFLDRHLPVYERSEKDMATFILNFQEKIRNIIPGRGYKNFRLFDILLARAQVINYFNSAAVTTP